MDPLKDVAEFHKLFQHPIKPEPGIPAKERADLRVALLSEELDELKAAIDANDFVEVADALCDLQYVLSGAVLEFGLKDKFPDLFAEVQRSNMSKACKNEKEAIDTQEYYRDKKGVESTVEKHGDYWLVFRLPDRKTLKNINYSPADLKQML
jgi:predicted HAD superfamily Cof-like phosphohydrolase